MFRLDGKVAAVTGAGSGIGEAIAVLFGQQGALVQALDVDQAAAGRTADRIRAAGGRTDARRIDVGDAASVAAAFAAIVAAHKKVDILVNNAGIAHVGTVETTTEADFDRVFRVNVKGIYLCAQARVRQMALMLIALGRYGQPEDVANAHLYLASSEADFISGVILPVAGGQLGA